MKKIQLKNILFLSILLFTNLAFSKTTGRVAAGLGPLMNYALAVKDTAFQLFYVAVTIYVIWTLGEAYITDQWNQIFKKTLLAAAVFGIAFSFDLIIRAVGGKTISKKYEIFQVVKNEKNKKGDFEKWMKEK